MTCATILLDLEATAVDTPLGTVRAFVGGTGPPVVLLHGLSGGAATWVEVVRSLAGCRIVALDLPGHGGSSPPPRGATIDWYADAVAAAIAELDVVPALVVGHSFGGQVAARLVERHLDLVQGLVLIGPSGVVRLPRRSRVLAVLTTVLRPGARIAPLGARLAGRPWFRHVAFGPLLVADPGALPARAVQGFFAEMREHTDVRTARRAILAERPGGSDGRLLCPAVVLWGASDAVVPVGHGFALARRARVQLRVVADCGHLLIGERPGAVLDAIAAVRSGEMGSGLPRSSVRWNVEDLTPP